MASFNLAHPVCSVSVVCEQSIAFPRSDDSFHGKKRVFGLLNSPRVASSLSDHILAVNNTVLSTSHIAPSVVTSPSTLPTLTLGTNTAMARTKNTERKSRSSSDNSNSECTHLFCMRISMYFGL